MRLLFHGGLCCGIKHIRNFSTYTDDMLPAVAAGTVRNHDQYGHAVNSELDFFTEEAPIESAIDRLDRLLAFCDKKRPSGIIEVTLAKGLYIDQLKVWEGELLKRGFKLVNSCYNSNSNNRVFVYHRNKE